MAFVEIAINQRGANPQVASDIPEWVREHGAFENVVERAYLIPLSPWAQGDNPEAVQQRRLGSMAREDVTVRISLSIFYFFSEVLSVTQAFLKSTKPLLLGCQLPVTLVEEMHENALTELREAKVPHCTKIQTVYALKKHPVSDAVTS
jgi:hypothetical protein